MHLTCSLSLLERSLKQLGLAIASRPVLPVLSHLVLTASREQLTLEATNLEIGIRMQIAATIWETGQLALPALLFRDQVEGLPPSSEVVLSERIDQPARLQMSTRGSRVQIQGSNPQEYPVVIPHAGPELPLLLEAAVLRSLLTQVVFAAQKESEEQREIFTGVQMQVRDQQLRLVASDLVLVATQQTPLPFDGGDALATPLLIPASSLRILTRLLPQEGLIQMALTPDRSRAIFTWEQMAYSTRLLSGIYPQIEQVFPDPASIATRIQIETTALRECLKLTQPFVRGLAHHTLRLQVGQNGDLVFSAQDPDMGDMQCRISVQMEGQEQDLLLNGFYLSAIASACSSSTLLLEVGDSLRPIVMRPVGGTHGAYVLMPLSFSGRLPSASAPVGTPAATREPAGIAEVGKGSQCQ